MVGAAQPGLRVPWLGKLGYHLEGGGSARYSGPTPEESDSRVHLMIAIATAWLSRVLLQSCPWRSCTSLHARVLPWSASQRARTRGRTRGRLGSSACCLPACFRQPASQPAMLPSSYVVHRKRPFRLVVAHGKGKAAGFMLPTAPRITHTRAHNTSESSALRTFGCQPVL
eukprot:363738-Chlamydomonas_euryale.AAC.10